MNIPDDDFKFLLSVAKERCNDLSERADHGESDFDDDVADLTEFIQKYDPKYVNPYESDEEDEDEDEDDDDDE